MSFWTLPSYEPLRKYRFKVYDLVTAGGYWWAKSIDKPSFDINVGEYQLTNHKFKFPGILTWSDISMTIVDSTSEFSSDSFYMALKNSGYDVEVLTGSPVVTEGGLAKHPMFATKISKLRIEQYRASGEQAEVWTLRNAFIKNISFGELSYEDDGLVEIKIQVSYDFAILETFPTNN